MTVALPPDDVLLHPARAALHAAVSEAPGITFRALAKAVERPMGTVRHHLNMMIRSGVLREARVGAAIAFMLSHDDRDAAQLTLLREPGLPALRDLVASAGRVCQSDLIAYLDGIWPRSTVQHRLNRLVAGGLVRVRPQGRLLFYEVAA
jgi:DNA-binding IclR family transcriptional regulator